MVRYCRWRGTEHNQDTYFRSSPNGIKKNNDGDPIVAVRDNVGYCCKRRPPSCSPPFNVANSNCFLYVVYPHLKVNQC